MTLQWYKSANIFGPDFRTLHTCRNFDRLLEWSLARTSVARAEMGEGLETAMNKENGVDMDRVMTEVTHSVDHGMH